MTTFKQFKEELANKLKTELTHMKFFDNDDIIVKSVINDIDNGIDDSRGANWDFNGMTNNKGLLDYIQWIKPVCNIIFAKMFSKYDDCEYDNYSNFVTKVFEEERKRNPEKYSK